MSGPTWNDPLYQDLRKGIRRKSQIRILKLIGVGILAIVVFSAGYLLRPLLDSPPPITPKPVASPIPKPVTASPAAPSKSVNKSINNSLSANIAPIVFEAIPVDEENHLVATKGKDPFDDLPPRSLLTGTEIIPAVGPTGLGTLTIKNGTGEDAAVKLDDTKTKLSARFVYVRGGDEFTVKGIGSGVYFLRYTQGSDWDPGNHTFRKSPTYSEFEQTLDFNERRTDTGVAYHDYTVTLQKVLHGNARTRRITKEQF